MKSEQAKLDELLERCELIGEFGDYDYSWWEFKAWYDQQARIYYWYQDSGCSCNSFMDSGYSIGDLSVGRKEELFNAAREAGTGGDEGWSDFMTAVRNHKPAA
jgi:hypothetical protein